ncbi:MAG: alpha/beta hydrolase [Desulfobacterales bacterium]|nr:alpha/beta hydrolase [Desulfobacterales bacterium]
MKDLSGIDFANLDKPEILTRLFHPRPEAGAPSLSGSAHDLLIPVEGDASVGARFHMTDPAAPNILFFHGNGEIVAEYDDFGRIYNDMGVNFMPVDYRGYGRSSGRPGVTSMMKDCHHIFDFTRGWLADNGYTGPFIVMGRSLGSASALELVESYKEKIDGLIIESGFAKAGALLQLLGINLFMADYREKEGFRSVDKMATYDKPTLVIHAEFDHIIPFEDGQALFDACPSADKTLLKIPKANHNDIFMRGMSEYMDAVKGLMARIKET